MMRRVNTGLRRSELYAIGVIVHHWAYLEHAVEKLIWTILDVPTPVGRGITAAIQFRGRLQMLEGLIAAKHAPMKETIKNLVKTLKDIEADRNLIVHGLWQRTEDMPDAFATSLRRSSSAPEMIYGQQFPSDRLESINTNIIDATNYVVSLCGVVSAARAPSPDK